MAAPYGLMLEIGYLILDAGCWINSSSNGQHQASGIGLSFTYMAFLHRLNELIELFP